MSNTPTSRSSTPSHRPAQHSIPNATPSSQTTRDASSNRGRGRRGRGSGSSRGRGRPSRYNPQRPDPSKDSSASSSSSTRGRRQKHSTDNTKHASANRQSSPFLNTVPAPAIHNQPADVTELSARLSELMARGAVECVICLDRIRRQAPLWNCHTCYTITHLHCARKWAGHTVENNTDESSNNIKNTNPVCPKCRMSIDHTTLFNYCYCSRRKAPSIEPGIVPGSCGEPCRKSLGAPGSACPHKCTLLCHPGPCPPCVALRPPQSCFCGKQTIVRTCGESKGTASCGKKCGRLRPCGHPCDLECHPGPCDECSISVSLRCYCGNKEVELPCSVNGFACGGICGKPLDCNVHLCSALCHEGPCDPCIWSPSVWQTCACGKQDLSATEQKSRSSCTDPIPSCGQVCERPLNCIGDHVCSQICGHPNTCGKCEQIVQAECRCGFSVKNVVCGEDIRKLQGDLLCNKKCNDRLKCRHHNCHTICCPFRKRKGTRQKNVIASERVWDSRETELSPAENRNLGHKCDEVCNKELSCGKHSCDLSCGHTGPCPPCGILIREPVTCACGAESLRPPVRCGTPTPSCRKKCPSARSCGHPCPDFCHFGLCPPCLEIVKQGCIGGHGESRFVHCHIGEKGIRCHRACGRSLQCGIHACRNPCHGNYPQECESSTEEGCAQVCGLPRKKCEHVCASQCHPGLMCPDVPCKELVPVTCPCGRRDERSMCLCGGSSSPQEGGNRVRLACDDECAAQARLRGFAASVGKRLLPDGTVVETDEDDPRNNGVQYSEFLHRFAENDPSVLNYFERELGNISLGRTKKLVLDDLPQMHRLVLHTLAELYSLESESTGSVKSRRIVVRSRPGVKPVLPKPLLSEAYGRMEQEKRRIKRENRFLAIHISSGTNGRPTSVMESEVHHHLKEHSGFYNIRGTTELSCKREGLLVEFSTMERASTALGSLTTRQGIIVETAHSSREKESKGLTLHHENTNVQHASSKTAPVWNDGEQTLGSRQSEPIFAVTHATATSQDGIDDDVPESWDD